MQIPTTNQEKLQLIETALADKKGENIQIISIPPTINSLFDYIVIVTATSSRQIATLIDEVAGIFKQFNRQIEDNATKFLINVDGNGESGWKAVSIDDIVVHAFTEEIRQNYKLEDLWHKYATQA